MGPASLQGIHVEEHDVVAPRAVYCEGTLPVFGRPTRLELRPPADRAFHFPNAAPEMPQESAQIRVDQTWRFVDVPRDVPRLFLDGGLRERDRPAIFP